MQCIIIIYNDDYCSIARFFGLGKKTLWNFGRLCIVAAAHPQKISQFVCECVYVCGHFLSVSHISASCCVLLLLSSLCIFSAGIVPLMFRVLEIRKIPQGKVNGESRLFSSFYYFPFRLLRRLKIYILVLKKNFNCFKCVCIIVICIHKLFFSLEKKKTQQKTGCMQ